MLLQGVNRPRPQGIAVKACRIFCVTDSNSANGMPLFVRAAILSHLCNIPSKNSRLGCSNTML
jgi:hypothetical protein